MTLFLIWMSPSAPHTSVHLTMTANIDYDKPLPLKSEEGMYHGDESFC